MKCNQCNQMATDSGSGLCKECEDEVMSEYYKEQEHLIQEVYIDIVNSQH